jgi:tRNA(Ile)-lysidine synthase
MTTLLNKCLKNISDNELLHSGDTVIVAVSGGADSMALLDILSKLEEVRLNLVVAHLDHMLRGDDSDTDAAFVRDAALKYGLPFELRSSDIRRFSLQSKLSLEEAGRKARYEWFDEVALKYGARAVALGHHADDQAETVLMRLLRGAGTTGLSGISPGAGSRYIRPLLCCTRSEIEEYLRERNLPFRTDESNIDTRFLRNRIRHELLPSLESYNPSIRDRLVATAEILSDDEELLESVTEQSLNLMASVGKQRVDIDLPSLSAQLRGLRLRLYRRAIRAVKGNLDHITLKHLRHIDDLALSGKANSHFRLPGHLQVTKCYKTLAIATCDADADSGPFELLVEGPGLYPLPGGRQLSVTVEYGHPGNWKCLPPCKAYIDAASAPFPWIIRTFRDGDRFTPFGMKGSKKLKDFFIDMKIPLQTRRNIPLVVAGNKILWIAGLRLAEEARLTASEGAVIVAGLIE